MRIDRRCPYATEDTGEMASSSQTTKWKWWIVGLQIANDTQLQLTILFLFFFFFLQKTTENSNSSAASLFSNFCFTGAGHGEFLPTGWQALWTKWHLKSLMVHKAHWNNNGSTALAFRWSQYVRSLLTQAPFTAPRLLFMHFTESPLRHNFLLSPAQKSQQTHRTKHISKGPGDYSHTRTDTSEHFKQAGWMLPVGWLVWFWFFYSIPLLHFTVFNLESHLMWEDDERFCWKLGRLQPVPLLIVF